MIITKKQAINMYNKLELMKSVSRCPVPETEFVQWCHNINLVNSLELDEYILGGKYQLSKMQLDNVFAPLVLPFMVTFNGDDKEMNLLSSDYSDYCAEIAISKYGYTEDEAKVMNPEEFKMVSEGILASFKKTSNLITVETLKGVKALGEYYKREAHGDNSLAIPENTPAWVPVQLSVNIKKERYLLEDTDFVFNEWYSEVLRGLKGSKNAGGQQPPAVPSSSN